MPNVSTQPHEYRDQEGEEQSLGGSHRRCSQKIIRGTGHTGLRTHSPPYSSCRAAGQVVRQRRRLLQALPPKHRTCLRRRCLRFPVFSFVILTLFPTRGFAPVAMVAVDPSVRRRSRPRGRLRPPNGFPGPSKCPHQKSSATRHVEVSSARTRPASLQSMESASWATPIR